MCLQIHMTRATASWLAVKSINSFCSLLPDAPVAQSTTHLLPWEPLAPSSHEVNQYPASMTLVDVSLDFLKGMCSAQIHLLIHKSCGCYIHHVLILMLPLSDVTFAKQSICCNNYCPSYSGYKEETDMIYHFE